MDNKIKIMYDTIDIFKLEAILKSLPDYRSYPYNNYTVTFGIDIKITDKTPSIDCISYEWNFLKGRDGWKLILNK